MTTPAKQGRIGLLNSITRRTSFKGNMFANYGGRIWEAGMSVAFVPLYIRYLGAEAYGVIGLVALIQAFMLILDFGMTPTLTRETARFEAGEHDGPHIKDLIRSIEWVTAGLCTVILLSVASAACFLSNYWVQAETLNRSTIAQAMMIGGALIATRLFESIYRGSLYGLQRQLLCNGIAAVAATIRAAGAVAVIALFNGGLIGFFAWQVGISLLAVLAMRLSVQFALPTTERRARFSLEALSGVWQFAAGMLLVSILSLTATQADKVLLSRIIPLRDFGYYVFAANVAVVIELSFSPALTAIYPRIVDLISRKQDVELRDLFHKTAKVVVAVTAPLAALLAVFAPKLILLWSGDPELAASAGPILSVVVLGTFLHAQCVLPYYVQLGHGWTSLSAWVNAGALFITIPSLIFLVPRFGTIAAAWTWVAVASVYFLVALNVMFSRHLKTERLAFYFGDVILPAAAAFATMWLCARLFGGLARSFVASMLTLGVSLALAAAASGAVAFASYRRIPGRPLR